MLRSTNFDDDVYGKVKVNRLDTTMFLPRLDKFKHTTETVNLCTNFNGQ